jgi:acyl-CoA hydrolase
MGLPFPRLTAEEAAAHVRHGETVAFSGFTPAGSPKAIPSAIAAIAEAAHQRGEPFKIGVLTGAFTVHWQKLTRSAFALLTSPTRIHLHLPVVRQGRKDQYDSAFSQPCRS